MSDEGTPGHSPLRRVLAVGMALAGGVWMLQGLGILTAGGSFMIGDPKWTAIGAVFVGAGILLALRTRRQ